MSNALIKEALRTIKRNKARFISIIAIVAVGISFYAGISAAGPDMQQTAVNYYDENNLMDIWMISTVGFNDNDVEAVKEVDGVEDAVGSKFADGTVMVDGRTAANVDGGQTICRAYGLDFTKAESKDKSYINRLTLIEGRFPQNENECVIDRSDMATPKGFEIGKTIKMVGIEENIEKFVETGSNLYIHSLISGNGKTEWSLRLLQSYINKIWFKSDLRCRVLFVNVPRYLIALKESITTPSEYVDHVKKHIFDADIVVFDEIGIKAATTFEFENLLNFINTRLDLGKSNIYTSNLTAHELNERLGSRLYSRIMNMSVDIEFRGSDKRGQLGRE